METTGPSVDDAVEQALDVLGVERGEAEVVVVAEPRRSLFGLRKQPARVRVRVRPTRPRPKQDRRDRRRREGKESPPAASVADDAPSPPASEERVPSGPRPRQPAPAVAAEVTSAPEPPSDATPDPTPERDTQPAAVSAEVRRPDREMTNEEGDEDMDRERDGTLDVEAAEKFVVGLAEAFGASAVATVTETEDFVDIDLEGDELGLLIGPRGQTLQSIQELARVVGQRGFSPQRLRIDVGGYRKRRQEALVRFALQIAAEVVSTGAPRALEPMPSPDRKVVHDAVQGVEGAASTSEGEDPQRRVIISPA